MYRPLRGDERRPLIKSHRLRKRDPRALFSKERRSKRGFPPSGAGSKSPAMLLVTFNSFQSLGTSPLSHLPNTHSEHPQNPTTAQHITLLQVNARPIDSTTRRAELQIHLLTHQPGLLLIEGTWLDPSTNHLGITNYVKVSRKDRLQQMHIYRHARGGIAVLKRRDSAVTVTHIAGSPSAERAWHILHTDMGPMLLGL